MKYKRQRDNRQNPIKLQPLLIFKVSCWTANARIKDYQHEN